MADLRHLPTLRFVARRSGDVIAEASFTDESITIGSGESAMLRIEAEAVAELHAVVNVEDDGSVQLLNLMPDAPVLRNGEAIANDVLADGDTLGIGDVELSLQILAAEDAIDTRPVDADLPTEEGPLDDESAVAVAAAVAPSQANATDVAGPPMHEFTEDAIDSVLRGGMSTSPVGLNTKAPKVLEVAQVWRNTVLDTRHFKRGRGVTIGASIGFQWSLLGLPLGWVPAGAAGVLRVSPPIWSEVRSDWRSDFYADDDAIPGGVEHQLVIADGNKFSARVIQGWDAWVIKDGERLDLAAAVAQGLARTSGLITEVAIEDGISVIVDVAGMQFVLQQVYPGAAVVAPFKDGLDYPFLGILSFCIALGALLGVVLATSPRPPENDLLDLPDRFTNMLIEQPEPEEREKDQSKPDTNKDAGEGEKAKKEEGKVGKKDAKMEKAKGEKAQVDKSELDRQIAENAGVLGAMDDAGAMDGVFAGGLNASVAGGIGGLIGAKGTQLGAGGLGSRGSGMGGGGSAEGLGGLGTRGMGSGSSGYGKGGGSFGSGGGGGVAARSGDPIIMGALDRALIDEVIKRKMSQIRYCYTRELQKDPTLAGKIVIGFTIARDGSVSTASPKSTTVNNGAVEGCIVQRFRQMQFPEPKGGGIVVVSYPFLFSPG